MPIAYNANEVYEIGIEIERNGKAFYEAAVESVEDPDTKKFLDDLAKWEGQHISLFEKLQSELSEQENEDNVFDPDNEAHLYLKAAAASHVFRKNLDITDIVAHCKNHVDILNMAIQFEKDSVVLYNTMIGMVPEHLGKDKIERLIEEELKHLSLLHEKLEVLK